MFHKVAIPLAELMCHVCLYVKGPSYTLTHEGWIALMYALCKIDPLGAHTLGQVLKVLQMC